MDWLDLFAAQGTLKSLLQHHGSKASILQCSAFFTVQLSHPYLTTGKTIALTDLKYLKKVCPLNRGKGQICFAPAYFKLIQINLIKSILLYFILFFQLNWHLTFSMCNLFNLFFLITENFNSMLKQNSVLNAKSILNLISRNYAQNYFGFTFHKPFNHFL